MEIFSLTFVYLILPAMLLICLILPMRMRPLFLTATSAVLYFLLEREYVILLLSVILFDFGMAHIMKRCDDFPKLRKAIMAFTILKSIAIIGYFSAASPMDRSHLTIGIPVVCLTSMGYVLDCYDRTIACETNLVNYALMIGFFPKLYAGPLVSHNRIMPQIRSMRMTLKKLGQGISLFVRGLAKKVILGDIMVALFESLRAIPLYDTTVLTVWSMVVSMAFAAYFILSGLCDMAKGMGLMFGFELPDNFRSPYCSLSVHEFFTRFNITVNRFLRRHVYIKLASSNGTMLSAIFNILLVTILMGLWFGITVNMLLWGIYFTVFLLFERYFLFKYKEFIPPLFRWIYCTVVIFVSFAIFIGDSPAQSQEYLKIMFGLKHNIAAFDNRILYLLTSNYLALIVSAFCTGGLPGRIYKMIKSHAPIITSTVSVVWDIFLLMLATAFLL